MPSLVLPRSILEVRGSEAEPFLNALLTNTPPAVHAGPGFAALLTPQGKVLTDMIVWRAGPEAFFLDVAHERAAMLAARLALYKLRSAVSIADASGEWAALALLDGAAAPAESLSAPDPRLAALPPRALVRTAMERPLEEPQVYRALRLELGVPDGALDAAPEEAFAAELLMEELNGLDFQKGCFVGQENVSRMKRRATTRRKLCRVRGAGLVRGAQVRAGDAALGELRSRGENVGLAMLRLDRALAATAQGAALASEHGPVTLDPPDWLILPAMEGATGAEHQN